MGSVRLTGFGDEIDSSLEKQLTFMEALGIRAIELRGVDGTNVSALSQEQAKAARQTLDAHNFDVSALGSPIGKTDIAGDFSDVLDSFQRTLDNALILRAPAIRLFSFYVPMDRADEFGDEAITRLARLKEVAAGSNVVLLHENEGGIYGETPEHCLKLAEALCDDDFALIFDPSNFVQKNWNALDAWHMMKSYVRYMHVKDSVYLPEGEDAHAINPHRVAGDGQAYIREILSELKTDGYAGYLSLEPHLTNSTYVSGTKPGKWAAAAHALQTLLDEIGIEWQEG